jgi:heptosyltransferase-2
VKPKLLVVELWRLGDLIIATRFLQAASLKYEVTLLAKPYAKDLQARFWPSVKVLPFTAPWTAFKHKYRLASWPWRDILRLRKQLASERFEFGLSARWDPRDHILLWLARAKTRLGFPRMGSQNFLSRPLGRPQSAAHPHSAQTSTSGYQHWRVLARALGLDLPAGEQIAFRPSPADGEILVHTGAGHPVRVWPLEKYRGLVARLRQKQYRVQVACDSDQLQWWTHAGEKKLASPRTVSELLGLVDRAFAFIGNDSGPGHLAAFCGVPTFTIFGPQVPEWFAPPHPESEWMEGKACPYKPCSDYCRFPAPVCMVNITEEEVWARVAPFVARACRVQIAVGDEVASL